jgi:hypothetical protein
MRTSSVIIALLWVLSLGASASGALESSDFDQAREIAAHAPLLVQLFPIPFFTVAALLAPHSPFFHPTLAKVIDTRTGDGTFEGFIVRLRPLLMFGTSALVAAILETYRVLDRGISLAAGVNVFFLAGGIGFVLAHFILRYRKVRGA